jgi:hypothetical protein
MGGHSVGHYKQNSLYVDVAYSERVSSDKIGTIYLVNRLSKIPPSTSMHFATRVRTWRVARLSAS